MCLLKLTDLFGNGEFSKNAVKIHWVFKNATNSFDMTTKFSNLLGSSATCCCSTSDAVSFYLNCVEQPSQKEDKCVKTVGHARTLSALISAKLT